MNGYRAKGASENCWLTPSEDAECRLVFRECMLYVPHRSTRMHGGSYRCGMIVELRDNAMGPFLFCRIHGAVDFANTEVQD